MSISLATYQTTYAEQNEEKKVMTFSTYEEAVPYAVAFMKAISGRYREEQFRDVTLDYFTDTHTTMDTMWQDIMNHKNIILSGEKECNIILQLDGTTERGYPILGTIIISCPEQIKKYTENKRNERLGAYGRYCYCGSPDCDWDCGTLPCGCIDACRRFCDGSDEDEHY